MSRAPMNTRTINISLPKDLVSKLDNVAKKQYATRSEYIRNSIIEQLNRSQDENWELVSDFTKIKKGGVDIDELISRL